MWLRTQALALDECITAEERLQRKHQAPDHAALKQQGFEPFSRGGQLRDTQNGKMLVCKKGEAVLPPAPQRPQQSRQAAKPKRYGFAGSALVLQLLPAAML